MLNKAILQGRLVADPELRRTQSGTAVASFRLACDRSFKSKDTNAQSADFINIVSWGNTAEFIFRYFTKGSPMLIEGRIQTRDYTDNNGQKHYITEVVAESVNFCGSKQNGNSGSSSGGYSQQNNYGGNPENYNNGYGGGYGGSPQSQQPAVPPSYMPNTGYSGYGGGQPQNQFAELNDDDGELPF